MQGKDNISQIKDSSNQFKAPNDNFEIDKIAFVNSLEFFKKHNTALTK